MGAVRVPGAGDPLRRPHHIPGAALLLHSAGWVMSTLLETVKLTVSSPVLPVRGDLVRHPVHRDRGDRARLHQGGLHRLLPLRHEHHRR